MGNNYQMTDCEYNGNDNNDFSIHPKFKAASGLRMDADGNIALKNRLSVDGDLDAQGDVTIAGSLTVSGRITDKTRPVMPVGSVIAYAGGSPPDGWLLCNGAAIPSQYTDLIAVVGNNTPNLCGRTVIGTGVPSFGKQSDGTEPNFAPSNNWSLNFTGGEYAHMLTLPEMPKHNHTSHVSWAAAGGGDYWKALARVGEEKQLAIRSDPAGGDAAHNNMQPYCALNYIVKC